MYDPNRSKNTTINNIEAAQQSAPSQFEKTRRIVLKSMACGCCCTSATRYSFHFVRTNTESYRTIPRHPS